MAGGSDSEQVRPYICPVANVDGLWVLDALTWPIKWEGGLRTSCRESCRMRSPSILSKLSDLKATNPAAMSNLAFKCGGRSENQIILSGSDNDDWRRLVFPAC